MGICRASGLGYPSSPFSMFILRSLGKRVPSLLRGVTLNPLLRGYWKT